MGVQVERGVGSRNTGLLPLRVSLGDEMWMCNCVFNGQLPLEWFPSHVSKDVSSAVICGLSMNLLFPDWLACLDFSI